MIKREYGIAMRDGIELKSLVFLPGEGSYPLVMVRTPYGKEQFEPYTGLFLQAGLGVFLQDVRGTGASAGEFTPIVNEENDSLDTLAWLKEQEWYNGRLGLLALSYLGSATLALAALSDDVKAVVASSVPYEINNGVLGDGNVFMLHHTLPWHILTSKDKKMVDFSWPDTYKQLPLVDVLDDPNWETWLKNMDNEEFWEQFNLEGYVRKIEAPVLHFGGWWDFLLSSVTGMYRILEEEGNYRQKLILGPWSHNGILGNATELAGIDYGSSSPFLEETLAWFSNWLKEVNYEMEGPEVKAFLMNSNEWVEGNAWPHEKLVNIAWAMTGAGELNLLQGPQAFPPSSGAAETFFEYDPKHPAKTQGGAVWEFPAGGLEPGSVEQDKAKPGRALIYTSVPLAQEITILGEIVVQLVVSTDAPATDFAVKLIDIYPDGSRRLVKDGIREVCFNHLEKEPDDRYPATRISLSLGETGYTYKVGHRLQVEVGSSNFPKYARSLNQPDRFFSEETPVALNAMHFDASFANRIITPLLFEGEED